MSVPENVRKQLRTRLWKQADDIGWMNLPGPEKSRFYEDWTRAEEIGGLLERYIEKGHIRVYIKDTLLKEYVRHKLADPERILRVLDLPSTIEIADIYVKPHGRLLKDGRIICWGRADDWKTVLLAGYERAYDRKGLMPFATLLLQATGRYSDIPTRGMVDAAAKKLGVERLIWLDT